MKEDAKKGRGRPITGVAKTSAEHQKAYRQRLKEQGARVVVQHPLVDSDVNDGYIDSFHDEIRQLREERDFYKHELRRYVQEAGDDFDKLFN